MTFIEGFLQAAELAESMGLEFLRGAAEEFGLWEEDQMAKGMSLAIKYMQEGHPPLRLQAVGAIVVGRIYSGRISLDEAEEEIIRLLTVKKEVDHN